MRAPEVAVVGHVGRDLVLKVNEVPAPTSTTPAQGRLELPGGKGYNQALSLVQLGHHTAVVGAVGDDDAGGWLVDCARNEGIDPDAIAVRSGAETSLILSLLEPDGQWRYIEDLAEITYAAAEDIESNRVLFQSALVTSLQMQEPPEATVEAARLAHAEGRLVVADGAPKSDGASEELLSMVAVLRAHEREAQILTGDEIGDARQAVEATAILRSKGPAMVMVAAGRDGNVFAWPDGTAVIPLADAEVVDSTGGGDALVAVLIGGLLSGCDPLTAACIGTAAAGQVARRPGGRPRLSLADVRADAEALMDRAIRTG